LNFIFVGVGGMFGGLCRFQLGKVISRKSKTAFPIGTFIINITGAILLGILTGIDIKNWMYLLLGDGFLGAYTTFSTFMYDGVNLFQINKERNALVYILSTLCLGIIGYIFGYEVVKLVLLY